MAWLVAAGASIATTIARSVTTTEPTDHQSEPFSTAAPVAPSGATAAFCWK